MAGANRLVKEQEVTELKDKISPAQVAIVGQCTGIDVEKITEFRKKVRSTGGYFKVVKNTLVERAVEGTSLEGLKAHFEGPTAMAYSEKDPVALAKVVQDFAKDQEKFQIKAGVLNGTLMNPAQVKALASTPSREVLLGRLVGSFQSPYAGVVYGVSGVLRKVVYALDAVRRKKEEQGA